MKKTIKAHNEVKVVLTTESVVDDPILAKGYQQFQILELFLDTLVKKGPQKKILSCIAEAWTLSSNHKVYTFRISDKARFHNGDNVTAADVVHSFIRHLGKEKSAVASYFENVVEKVVAVGDYEVKISLRGPYPPFLELLTMPGFGIISRKSSTKVIGSGPYIFDESVGQNRSLKKAASYKGKTSNIDRYSFFLERNVERIIEMLNSNNSILAMGAPLEVAFSDQLRASCIISPKFSMAATHILLNHCNPFIQKKANRVLLANVANLARTCEGVITKFATPLNNFVPHGVMPEDYYVHLLPSTGVPKIAKREKLRLVFPYGIFLQETLQKIVATFELSGFDASYINVKGKVLLQALQNGEFDLVFIPYQGVVEDPDGYLDLLDPHSIFAKSNLPTSDTLRELSTIRFTANEHERLQKYKVILNRMEKEFLLIPFTQNSIPVVRSKNIELRDGSHSAHINLRDLNIITE